MVRPKRDGRQVVAEAKQIAADHGLVVAEKTYGTETAYSVYRKLPYAGVTFLGSRKSPDALRSLVCASAGFR